MNRLEIRLALQQRIGDTSAIRTTTDEANHYIDDGYNDLAERTGIIVRTATISISANQHFVSYPDDCLYPLTVRDLGSGYPIDPKDWPFIDKLDRLFIRTIGTRPQIYASVGLGEFLIHPAYQAAGSMEMIYAAVPDPLDDTDTPEFPPQHHMALVYYAHHRVLLKDAHGDLAGPRLGRAQRQWNNYLRTAMLANKWAMDRHGAKQMVMGSETLRAPEIQDLNMTGASGSVL